MAIDNDPLARLEERIGRAVTHIEELKKKNKNLADENADLRKQMEKLEEAIGGKEAMIKELETKTAGISENIREKLEGLISKIDRYEEENA